MGLRKKMINMVPRPPLAAQRHAQLKAEFDRLVDRRRDMVPGDADYETKCTEIDQVLASVWRLGTIYSRTPGAFEPTG